MKIENLGAIGIINESPEHKSKADRLEAAMLNMPQLAIVTNHYFGPGIYMREVIMPAGAVVVGHKHTGESMNDFVRGKMLIFEDDGQTREISAPMVFTNQAGRKAAYIIEEVVWRNIYATTETDLEKLEQMYIEKSDQWSNKMIESTNKIEAK